MLCAVTYIADEKDVSGWFIGLKDYAYPAAYFRIENFFSPGAKRFYAVWGWKMSVPNGRARSCRSARVTAGCHLRRRG